MVQGKPGIDSCSIHILVVEAVLDQMGNISRLDDPASHGSPQVMYADIVQGGSFTDPTPGFVDVDGRRFKSFRPDQKLQKPSGGRLF